MRAYKLGVEMCVIWDVKTLEGHGDHPRMALELAQGAGRDGVCWREVQEARQEQQSEHQWFHG